MPERLMRAENSAGRMAFSSLNSGPCAYSSMLDVSTTGSFRMRAVCAIRRGSGKQYVQRKPEIYRAHVRRKLAAYERHIQLGLIAQGLLQYLALSFRRVTWFNFHSYIRTASSKNPPFGMGRLSCASSHLAAFSPRFLPK